MCINNIMPAKIIDCVVSRQEEVRSKRYLYITI